MVARRLPRALVAACVPLATRERILFEAAHLFAAQGFHATTTRQIAEAVGIRQPSLFHHFATKDAIVEALFDWDLGLALPRTRAVAALPEPAAVRLYRYLHDDLRHLEEAPYNLSGLYADEVIGRPEFAPWAERRDLLHRVVAGIVREGTAAGEFIEVDATLVSQAIAGILVRALTLHSGGRAPGRGLADEVARLVVRGLLADPAALEEVQGRAALLRLPGE